MNIKYFVRTTGERDLSNYSFLDYTPLYDYEHKPMQSFINQLNYISDYDSVFLEDDLEFCKDFKTRIEEVISQYPNMIINFYHHPTVYYKTHEEEGRRYLWNQCTYYPKGISKLIANKMQELVDNGVKWTQYDVVEAKALDKLGINFIVYRPFLINHIGKESLLGNDWINHGRGIFFIDDLEKEGLDYNDIRQMVPYINTKWEELNIPHIVRSKE